MSREYSTAALTFYDIGSNIREKHDAMIVMCELAGSYRKWHQSRRKLFECLCFSDQRKLLSHARSIKYMKVFHYWVCVTGDYAGLIYYGEQPTTDTKPFVPRIPPGSIFQNWHIQMYFSGCVSQPEFGYKRPQLAFRAIIRHQNLDASTRLANYKQW